MFGRSKRIVEKTVQCIDFEEGKKLMIVRVNELREKVNIIKAELDGTSKGYDMKAKDFSVQIVGLNASLEQMWHGLWGERDTEERVYKLIALKRCISELSRIYEIITKEKNYLTYIPLFEEKLMILYQALGSSS